MLHGLEREPWPQALSSWGMKHEPWEMQVWLAEMQACRPHCGCQKGGPWIASKSDVFHSIRLTSIRIFGEVHLCAFIANIYHMPRTTRQLIPHATNDIAFNPTCCEAWTIQSNMGTKLHWAILGCLRHDCFWGFVAQLLLMICGTI